MPGTIRPKLLLADDHELMINGLQRLLIPEFDLVATASDGLAAVAAFEKFRPDVALLDVGLPLLNGIEATRQIRRLDEHARVILVTMEVRGHYVEQAFRAGAMGYVVKNAAVSELIDAIYAVIGGKYFVSPLVVPKPDMLPPEGDTPPAGLFGGELTARQREVLQLIAEGKSNKEMAFLLNISPRTVEFHRRCISRELGQKTTAELVRYALENGIAH